MNEIIYTDELSGVDKNLKVSPTIPFDPKTDGVFNFFVDDQRVKDMFQTLSLQALTTKDLQLIATQVQTKELKNAVYSYIGNIQKAEKNIIYYLEQKWYINRLQMDTKASIIFTNETINYIPKEFLEQMETYLFGKWYFQKEFEKIDDENGVYKFVIEVKYEENESYIQNITIEKI